MEPLPRIPIPPRQRWREFRVAVLPAIIFVLVLGATALMWKEHVTPPHIVGEVESTWASVVSKDAGIVARLSADRFQRVSAGEPIAELITTDPRIIDATLAMIRAEVEMLQTQTVQAQQRVVLDYERLRLNWLLERVRVATAKVHLHQAESEFQRVNQMFEDQIAPRGVGFGGAIGLEVAERDRDALLAEISSREEVITDIGGQLDLVKPPATHNPLSAAIALSEEKLRLAEAQLSPVTLFAPMDGLVSFVHRRAGETVTAGEPILTLSSLRSDRIVAYIRQPLRMEPSPGMEVVVRSRSGNRRSATAQILEVGRQMEPIKPTLLPATFFSREETGLPILVALPPELNLIPGEIVDLLIRPKPSRVLPF